jgi:hypothetical protein
LGLRVQLSSVKQGGTGTRIAFGPSPR